MDKDTSSIEHTTFSFNEGIYVVNKHGYITYMNSEAERLLGETREELVNKKIKLFDKINYQIIDGIFTFSTNESIGKSNKSLLISQVRNLFTLKHDVYPIIENNDLCGVVIVFRNKRDVT